jgi:hypothetical protein
VPSGIRLVSFDSKSELREHLRKAKKRTVLIGADVEAPREFYSALLPTSAGAPIEIGLIAAGLGTKPSMHVMAGGEIVLIGYDTYVAGIETATATIRFQIELLSVFFDFLSGTSDDTAIVVYEIGAIMIDAKGEQRWSIDTDILEQWHNDGMGGLWLKNLYGQKRMRVDIVTGEISRER